MNDSVRLRAGGLAIVVSLIAAQVSATPPERAAGGGLQSGTSAAMTNQDVIKMVGAGLADDVIVTAIRQAPRRAFDLTPSGLIDLKLAHVPDAIVRAMQAVEDTAPPRTAPESRPVPAAAPPASPRPMAPASSLPPPTASAPSSTTLQEPSAPGELFFVAPGGALTALERVRLKDRKVGNARSQGIFKPSVQDFAYYFDGAASPVTFRSGDPQVFVIRMLGSSNRNARPPTPDEAQKHFLLTKLQSDEGKRYVTKVDVQFDVRSYGRPTPGLDPKKSERVATSFQLTPRTVLGPGEYVVLLAGTSNFEFLSNLSVGAERWAFSIVDR